MERLLVVEDNAINRKVALAVLTKLGYTVELAADGAAAVAAFRHNTFDAILMDCQLPGMDGYEATAAMRALETGRRTPIIAMTASTVPADRERCLAAGMDDHVSKPINREQLASVLRAHIPSSVRI